MDKEEQREGPKPHGRMIKRMISIPIPVYAEFKEIYRRGQALGLFRSEMDALYYMFLNTMNGKALKNLMAHKEGTEGDIEL